MQKKKQKNKLEIETFHINAEYGRAIKKKKK